jgi:hypothetical protein
MSDPNTGSFRQMSQRTNRTRQPVGHGSGRYRPAEWAWRSRSYASKVNEPSSGRDELDLDQNPEAKRQVAAM